MNKTVGVLGGMGPLATAMFLQKVVTATPATRDQEHIDMITYSMPSIPDRTAYIKNNHNENPLAYLEKHLTSLAKHTDFIVIPCMTAMYFYDQIRHCADVVNFPELVINHALAKGYQNLGVLGTDGTVVGRVFDKQNVSKTNLVYPDTSHQQKLMKMIYDDIKKGEKILEIADFLAINAHMKEKEADVLLLACTELSIINDQHNLTGNHRIDGMLPCIDVLDVLAEEVVRRAHIKTAVKR